MLLIRGSNQLLNELETLKTNRLKEIKTRTDEVERQLLIVESFKQYVEELTTKGTPCDVTRSSKDLLARRDEIVTSQTDLDKNKLGASTLRFSASEGENITRGQRQLIGTVTMKGR